MVSRTAGNYVYLAQRLYLFISQPEFVKHDSAVLDNRVYGIPDDLGLFVYLLEHEVLIAALFCGFGVPLYLGEFLCYLLTLDIVELYFALRQLCYLQIADIINVPCIFEYGRHIGSHISFAVSDTYYHGAVLAGCVDLFGIFLEHNAQRITAAYTYHSPRDGVNRTLAVLAVVVVYQLNSDFGISLRPESVACLYQLLFKFLIVLYDAVVYRDDIFIVSGMRVSVQRRWFTMSRPSCMTYTAAAFYSLAAIGHIDQHCQLAFFLYYLGISVTVAHSDASRVITSVFQFGQTVQQHRCRLTHTCKSNYSAHVYIPPSIQRYTAANCIAYHQKKQQKTILIITE